MSLSEPEDFLDYYIQYVGETEVPTFFNRWAAIGLVSAWLKRDFYLSHGHFEIYPNHYLMLMGISATRKSTAIKVARGLLHDAGYTTIAAEKTSKEAMLMDMQAQCTPEGGEEGADDMFASFSAGGDFEPSPHMQTNLLIAADEFNDFIGINNLDFISALGSLWDFKGIHRSRVKNGKSVAVPNPTISILGGNTPTGFAAAFPPEALGQGFFSRLILIHQDPTFKRITFPKRPDESYKKELIEFMYEMKVRVVGQALLSEEAQDTIDKIYKSWVVLPDPRFAAYSNRRLTHLLKLCLVMAACRLDTEITSRDVFKANTILTQAELNMPRAMGEFGAAKNSKVTDSIMQILKDATQPVALNVLFKQVHTEVNKLADLADIMNGLIIAEKVQSIKGAGFLPVQIPAKLHDFKYVLHDYLSPEETGELQ